MHFAKMCHYESFDLICDFDLKSYFENPGHEERERSPWDVRFVVFKEVIEENTPTNLVKISGSDSILGLRRSTLFLAQLTRSYWAWDNMREKYLEIWHTSCQNYENYDFLSLGESNNWEMAVSYGGKNLSKSWG